MATIRPDIFHDFYTMGRATGTKEDLAGREFLTHCPPDVPPRHRIVALLGTTDLNDASRPSEDGWFVSDFYLFHYLLAPQFPRREYFIILFAYYPPTNRQSLLAPNQIWLTCDDPTILVQKYGEYLHGDSTGDRRIVLDAQILPDILAAGNLRVVPQEDLLERYLNTVREQAIEADRLEEHLVLLIFGHGSMDHHVFMGNTFLKMNDMQRVLQGKSLVTIFSTSCYSGAAGKDTKSSSWPLSGSVGRASGSLAAAAVVQCLIKAETDEAQTGTENPLENGEIMAHPTYIQLAKSVYDCVKDMGMLGDRQELLFAAENDEWELSYQPRLGLPLMSYKEKWQALRFVPPSSTPAPTNQGLPGANRRPLKRLQYLAEEYFAAQPGPDNSGQNIALHSCLRQALKGENFTREKLLDLTENTAYRLGAMYEAEYLRQQANIDYPSIFEIDTNIILARKGSTDRQLRSKTWDMLLAQNINTTPIGIKLQWGKPSQYLMLALIETLGSWEAIQDHIKVMAAKKKTWCRFIFRAWQGHRVSHNDGVITRQRAFIEALKKARE
ncbi:hypothetical protein N7447_002544 [Penicillium robsamsonii]|uniref:uncharacterized protein n=1 Tax=Penicillium robsamsonii TaxID=1792511 RepID=UPI00254773F0|nr:uncharacterized protein N7447_002544 [Penicillium robsamsonii]KAJ5836518.1 hypothetical protein N7447_002544 [Penicillium robsamsonii]